MFRSLGISNKKGEEYVEASMTLPLLILAVVTITMVTLFFYESLYRGCEMHMAIVEAADRKTTVFSIIRDEEVVRRASKGIFSDILISEQNARWYQMNQAKAIIAGELIS